MDPCIAYIHLHHFYALLEAKYRPNLSQVPFVVTQGEKIMDVSPQAANLNIHVAMGLRQARLICPELEIIKMEVDPEPFLRHSYSIGRAFRGFGCVFGSIRLRGAPCHSKKGSK